MQFKSEIMKLWWKRYIEDIISQKSPYIMAPGGKKWERIFVMERYRKESLNAVKGNGTGTELVPLSDFGKGTEILSSF